MNKQGYVYILTNLNNSVLYIGVTSNLVGRIYQHKHKLVDGFSSSYNLTKLVYFEVSQDISSAIAREKQLKNWHREWKVNLVNSFNSDWRDLYEDITLSP